MGARAAGDSLGKAALRPQNSVRECTLLQQLALAGGGPASVGGFQ